MISACKASRDHLPDPVRTPLRHSNDDRPPIVDPRLEALFEYWVSLRDDRSTPERRDFDPTMTPTLLNCFWILKRDAETGRYRFQLAGEQVSALLGRRVLNLYIDEVFADFGHRFNSILDTVTATPAVYHLVGSAYVNGDFGVQTERLALPMADNGVIDTVFGATIFDDSMRIPANALRYTGVATDSFVSVDGLRRPVN